MHALLLPAVIFIGNPLLFFQSLRIQDNNLILLNIGILTSCYFLVNFLGVLIISELVKDLSSQSLHSDSQYGFRFSGSISDVLKVSVERVY